MGTPRISIEFDCSDEDAYAVYQAIQGILGLLTHQTVACFVDSDGQGEAFTC